MLDAQTIRLAHYEAADAPRIMLFGPMHMNLEPLRQCFIQLSTGQERIDLEELAFVHAPQLRLRLQSTGDARESNTRDFTAGLRRLRAQGSYVWRQSGEEWKDAADLLSPLILSAFPCHQYLPGHPADDAVVVISRGEYEDNLLS